METFPFGRTGWGLCYGPHGHLWHKSLDEIHMPSERDIAPSGWFSAITDVHTRWWLDYFPLSKKLRSCRICQAYSEIMKGQGYRATTRGPCQTASLLGAWWQCHNTMGAGFFYCVKIKLYRVRIKQFKINTSVPLSTFTMLTPSISSPQEGNPACIKQSTFYGPSPPRSYILLAE